MGDGMTRPSHVWCGCTCVCVCVWMLDCVQQSFSINVSTAISAASLAAAGTVVR